MDNKKCLKNNPLSQEMIMNALFKTYESIYAIDVNTASYICCYQSHSYGRMGLGNFGDDFFADLEKHIPDTVYGEDQSYVKGMLSKNSLREGLKKDKTYAFAYRLNIDGRPVYHQVRVTVGSMEEKAYFILGVKNIDSIMRKEKEHFDKMASMLQKEKNHMEVILSSAEAYLEANLTKDIILEKSIDFTSEETFPAITFPFLKEFSDHPLRYSIFEQWWVDYMVVSGAEKYNRISSREYLINCFLEGDKRATVFFNSRTASGEIKPCRQVFYLYQDDMTKDIFCFSVVYDLTEQQRKERELKELEEKLRMSRIRNSASQMQPHFLYNALGSIQEIVLEDPVYASELIEDFTIHLRSCIRAMANDETVPFEEELKNIRAYTNIEKMRFGKKLHICYDILASDFLIIPLSVQPLVENAIRHGIYERGPSGGTVTIRSWEEEKSWIVQVEDDGVGFDIEEFEDEIKRGERDSTGLKNLTFRLEKVMNADFEIISKKGVGTTVSIDIPKVKEQI